MLLWHAPALYQATLQNQGIHLRNMAVSSA
jgi:hypothetical protein